MAGTFFDLIGWECQLVELSHFENPPNVVIFSKYRFYYRSMVEVPMSVFSNYIRTIDASSCQNKCPEHFSSLASILILIELLYRGGLNRPTATEIPPTGGRCMRSKKFQWFFWFLSHRPIRVSYLLRSRLSKNISQKGHLSLTHKSLRVRRSQEILYDFLHF